MFAIRYFCRRFFADRYFPNDGGVIGGSGGGYFTQTYFCRRYFAKRYFPTNSSVTPSPFIPAWAVGHSTYTDFSGVSR